MKRFVRGTLAALAMTFVGVAGAEAQLTELEEPPCEEGDLFHMAVGYTDCRGNFSGNNTGTFESDVIDYINNEWSLGVTSGSTTDAGDLSGAGPFQAFAEDQSSGTLQFDNPVSGDFVIALKAATFFSLYLFEGADNWDHLDFNTDGVALSPGQSNPQGLSHATLYGGGTVTVPEPASMLLLGTGLIGLGIVARRGREEDSAA